MAEITEAEARRICEALGRDPNDWRYRPANEWPDIPAANLTGRDLARVPLWRIVQRAAAGGDNDA